jgi:outer membrane receptor protein involved in Fe transport
MASRFIGKYTSSNVTGNTNEILETGDFTMLDLAVRRSFFKDRLLTSLGVNNVLNTQFINQNTYRFVQFDRELVNQNRVIEERGRYFFTKLTFTIN